MTTTTTARTTAPERPGPASDFGGEPEPRTRTAHQGHRPEFQAQMGGNARGCRGKTERGSKMLRVGAQQRHRGVGSIATSEGTTES